MAENNVHRFTEAYSSALQVYLQEGGESTLKHAYELGRYAMANHLGSLDLAETHESALLAALAAAPTPADSSRLVRLASDFFVESLSPFEMTHRGFLDAVATLSRRSVELAALNKKLKLEIVERTKAEVALKKENAFVHLLQIAAIAANMASTLEQSLQISLEEIAAATGWPLAHASIRRDEGDKELSSTRIWHLSRSGSALARQSPQRRAEIAAMIGLPRRILDARRPVWIPDVSADPEIAPQKKTLHPVRSACGFPILAGKKVVAAAELYSDRVMQPDEKLMAVMSNVGTQLGRVVERKKAEEVLRAIPRRILEAQEVERKRVAMELHDDICQRLSALKIQASLLQDEIPGGARKAASGLRSVEKHIVGMIDDVRRMSFHLHPAILHELGLLRALRQLAESFQKDHTIRVRFHSDGFNATDPPPHVTMAIYRIAQEALSNVAKHSGAKTADVEIAKRKRTLSLSVEDKGRGFIVTAKRNRQPGRQGLGLISMEERATLIGGKLHLTSSPGKGTIVRVDVPLRSTYGKEEDQGTDR